MIAFLKKVLPQPAKAAVLRLKNRLQKDPSENGETEILQNLLVEDDVRFLVDVGAHDGRHFSNSYLFLQAGWKGILIEPMPRIFEILRKRYKDRSEIRCVNMACSATSGQGYLFVGSDGQLGMTATLCTDENDWFGRTRTDKALEVRIETLTRILRENGAPRKFAILLVDTEGLDFEVLSGLDFREFEPRIILTEDYPYDAAKLEKKNALLETHGYRLHLRKGGNSIWVRISG